MNAAKGRTALKELASRPARRTYRENRRFVSERLEEMREARAAGYGFESIRKTLREAEGIRISATTLQAHYSALTTGVALNNRNAVMLVTTGENAPMAVQKKILWQDLRIGHLYELALSDGRKQYGRMRYRGVEDGKHCFDVPRDGGGLPATFSLSSAKIRHYAFRKVSTAETQ